MEPSLWAQLIPEPEDLSSLNSLLRRFGKNVRYLKIASHGPFRLSASLKPEQLSKCVQLEELFLGGFRGRDLESFCQSSFCLESLKSLTIECDPYFNLGSFSHNTGTHMASLPASWLSCFPNLERLVCDYLRLEVTPQELPLAADCESDSASDEEILWRDEPSGEVEVRQEPSGANPQVSLNEVLVELGDEAQTAEASRTRRGLELPAGAILPRERRERKEEVESVQPMAKLTSLSFVAVVRGQGSTWNSPRCRCDVAVLALLAPALERLQIRSPNIALGRMSRRPGQRMDGLIRVSRHFCSTGLRDLLAAGYLLPHLKELKVEVLKDDTGQPWDTGSVLTVPGSKSGRPSSGTTHLALALGVQDRDFQLCVGASEQLAGKLRLANVPAGGSSIATFQSFAVAEQHLPLLQLLQRYQDKLTKETTSPCDFEVDIVEVT